MKALNKDWENTPIDLEVEVLVDEKPKKIKQVFCKNWDVARIALEMAKSAVKKPLAKLVLTIAIRIGDGIYTRNCG